jgi:hypothetical protein
VEQKDFLGLLMFATREKLSLFGWLVAGAGLF